MKRNLAPRVIAFSALVGVSELFAQTSVPPSPAVAVAVTGAITATSTAVAVGPAATPANIVVTPTTPAIRPGTADQARIVNLSTRARVTPTEPLITGFAINGTVPRPVLVRAAGPGLNAFGVDGALATTRLEVRDASGALIAANAGWGAAAALTNAFAQAGAFPFAPGSADSAALVTLVPGSYTVNVIDASGASASTGGVALAEIYDLGNRGDDSRLVNVSTRANVAPAGGELISGFVLDGFASRDFLVRGVGPGLTKFGVSGTLADPAIALFDSTGQRVATNDNWNGPSSIATSVVTSTTGTPGTAASTVTAAVAQAAAQAAAASVAPSANAAAIAAASSASGAFALDQFSKDAALVATLFPGAYTVQVNGVASQVTSGAIPGSTTATTSATGVALLEIYEVQ